MTRPLTTQEQAVLDWWLEVATKDLIPQARARIRLEIEAHYTEAVEVHLADGCSESDAHTDALAELGEAQAAAKAFRKRYPTEEEVKKFDSMREVRRSIGRLLAAYACAAPLVLFVLILAYNENFQSSKYFLLSIFAAIVPTISVGYATVSFFIARFASAKSSIPALLLADLIQSIAYCILWCAYYWSGFPLPGSGSHSASLFFLALAPFCFMYFFYKLRRWNKVRKAMQLSDEATPDNPIAS